MKVIAFYLPQYHQTPENDEWWEKGFTEWNNVKRAKAVFKCQKQPKIPLNNNYYDLMDKNTVEWQTDLMSKYGVYGFCYFHYWFTGKKLLHKPAENLLKWKEINQPFCFAWANVTWARTWTAYSGASTKWVSDDKKVNGNGILLEQKYGSEQDWIEHYTYLKQFFADPRYIKVENKPLFLIYHIEYIKQAKEMFAIWDDLSKKDGFGGIHIVSINCAHDEIRSNPYVDAVARYGLYRKYDNTFLKKARRWISHTFNLKQKKSNVLDYKTVWKNMLRERPIEGMTTYPGAVVMYDDTPRRGKDALFLRGATPQLFEKYISRQIKRAQSVYHSEFLFFYVLNEWGEGNYLEPDEECGYAYLEALKNALDGKNR